MHTIPLLMLLQEGKAVVDSSGEASQGGLLSLHGGLMIWTLAIFLVVMYILTKYAFKPITAAVEAREKSLEEAIAAAKTDREEAHRILEEQRRHIDESRAEAQKLIVEGRVLGEKLRADMIEETRGQQQDMLERARREIEAEKTRAIFELRREAVELAIAGAGKVIEKNLDNDSNRKIVESFLASLPVSAPKS